MGTDGRSRRVRGRLRCCGGAPFRMPISGAVASLSDTMGVAAAHRSARLTSMPLTVFDCKGISATRREIIEAAVEAAGKHVAQPYEGWIVADPFRGGVRVLITGPQGFERTVVSPSMKPRRRSRSESERPLKIDKTRSRQFLGRAGERSGGEGRDAGRDHVRPPPRRSAGGGLYGSRPLISDLRDGCYGAR